MRIFDLACWQRALTKLRAEKAAPNHTPRLRNWKQHAELALPLLRDVAVQKLCGENPVIPPEWSEVQLAWLIKPKKSPCTAANLRTVGLMSGDTKLFTMVLKEAVQGSVNEALFAIPQFAYRRLSSTVDALLRGSLHCVSVRAMLGEVSTDLTARLTAGQLAPLMGGVMVSLDLAKAFDCLPFSEMYDCLRQVGVHDNLARLVVGDAQTINLHCEALWSHGQGSNA